MGNRPELSLTEDLQVYHVESESRYYTGLRLSVNDQAIHEVNGGAKYLCSVPYDL
jgi:hypothetical protein